MLDIKKKITEMKNPFDGLISGLDMVEEIISKLEYVYIILKKRRRRAKVEN